MYFPGLKRKSDSRFREKPRSLERRQSLLDTPRSKLSPFSSSTLRLLLKVFHQPNVAIATIPGDRQVPAIRRRDRIGRHVTLARLPPEDTGIA